jgi:NAD(P)-dependent dehydrogenase (short-subunit alcohol dehydrogenase family)
MLEESSMDELRQQFDVNVFGAVAMIEAVLPYMRARGEGRILNGTSMGGLMDCPIRGSGRNEMRSRCCPAERQFQLNCWLQANALIHSRL